MDYEPIIEGIAKLIGAASKAGEKGPEKPGTIRHTSADVERWLGPLSNPEKQVPLIHDYLRGHSALSEAEATGATHVRDISKAVWESAQKRFQSEVDADPEVQEALRGMYLGKNTAKIARTVELDPGTREPDPLAREVSPGVSDVPQAKVQRGSVEKITDEQRKNQEDAWNEFAVATEEQDAARIDGALERIKELHSETEAANPKGTVEQPAGWTKALDYMAGLEQQIQQMQAAKVPNETWSKAIEQWRTAQGIDEVKLPKHVRDTVTRFEAWADAMKPPSPVDRVTEVLGVPRSVMSSADFSAHGRQGILMIGRPEYWKAWKPMFEAWDNTKFAQQESYIRNHPDFSASQDAGLALTGLHEKLGRHEEAFQSRLAERIPILGNVIKSSEQAYSTFLNHLRLNVFSNELKAASAAGVDVADKKFLSDLAEWINTATGRGGGKNFNPGVLSTILFSPRLAWARLQTLNPVFYAKLHPQVRQAAIKQSFSAAAAIYSLVSLAGLAGAKVTWDFRNPDAGKVRIGDTRLDLGGGLFQWIRLFTQIASNQKVNADTGKVTELGSKYGVPTRLDLLTNFLISKEAPVASFVTDWLRGKDTSGKKFSIPGAVASRLAPLLMQDVYDVLKDQGVEGLLYMVPAAFGVGVQTYKSSGASETIPFIGVKGEVPPEKAAEYARLIQIADTTAAAKAAAKTQGMNPYAAKSVLRAFVKAERLKVRVAWIRQNVEAYKEARKAGEPSTPLVAPETP